MTVPALLLALAIAQPAWPPPVDSAAKPEPMVRDQIEPPEMLRIPGEISLAVTPYLICMQTSRGNNVRADPGDPHPPGVAVASDCSAQRMESAQRANEMLRAGHRMNAERRREFIEETLGNIDRHFLPDGPAASRPAGATGSIDIPYQAIPAYQAYAACVGDHFLADPRHDGADVEQVRQTYTEAIAACREVRAQQLARALAAQTDIRLYGSAEAGRAAVRHAFDRFDTDYQIETVASARAAPKE